MMEKIPISKITVISPMFSYGNEQLEPRPTELKGLLRNTYRIANPELDVKTLYQYEVKRFGGQLQENGAVTIKASPLRIQVSDVLYQALEDQDDSEYLLFHKKSPKKKCYPYGTTFKVSFTVRDSKQWYTDLLNLSLILGGIGKRSRRGRGCMTTDELMNIPNNDLPYKVVSLLNYVGENENYIVCDGKIILKNPKTKEKHKPYIKEIHFGNSLTQATWQDVKAYLKKVDQVSHNIKSNFQEPYATGFIKPNRFASSLIVSLAKFKDGIVPVYTLLHAVCKDEHLKFNNQTEEQHTFIDEIEEGCSK